MASADEKVRKLIALAIDHAATENESRNAAIQAVKLIAEHGLLSGGARPSRQFDFDELILAPLRQRIRLLESHIRGAEINERMLKGTIAVLERKVHQLEGSHARGQQEEPRVWRVNPRHASAGAKARTIIVSKFAGRCAHCNEPYEIGDFIAWAKGRSTFHRDCYEEWLQESA